MKHKTMERMGTQIVLNIEHVESEILLEQADRILEDYEKRFSANHPNSDLMTINDQSGIDSVHVDSDLFELIQMGKQYSLSFNGSLNIAIGPLVKLWKIGFDGAQIPRQVDIDERLELINPNNIELNPESQSVYLNKKGMEIDLGALAKGYFADRLKQFFMKKGVKNGLIDLGGNVLTIGESPKHADGFWRVGIQQPSINRGALVGAVLVKNKSVVTSGIYERFFEMNGKKYHHIFDSATGYPIENNLASVTIVSNESIHGELFTTVLFKMSPQEAIQYIESLPHMDAIIITKEKDILLTKDIKPYVALFNTSS
ncbi:FAD:protein FMN transferase [Virgibacillus sp. NKC19-3]|uniref:FAD:protein FMN transferase n=1 Tax=Virgibacillus saliphilus TaxID=2831674 RepID=UPI001C9AECCA|nr:FAD:protein FMN transferase [Virgibacillus sp. NKC19-3]MBY7144257.1 FAD:protein FMN transferase [Virgibacillus sp. NKC19-3]